MAGPEEKGFKVTDRRTVRPEDGVEDGPAPTSAVEAAPLEGRPGDATTSGNGVVDDVAAMERGTDGPRRRSAVPPMSFSTIVISLGTQALVHLGEVADPGTNEVTQDLDLARQTIDMLGILEEKTRGNLSEEEAALLRHLLTDMRMRFVALRQKHA